MKNEVQQFLDQKNFSNFTRFSYNWMLQRAICWIDEQAIPPETFGQAEFRRFAASHNWGPSTIYTAYCAMRSFFRWRYGLTHPMYDWSLSRRQGPPLRSLTEEQAAALFQSEDPATLSGRRNLALLALMLDTGLRESEVLRIQLEKVDLDHGQLWVIVKGGKWEKAVFSVETAVYLADWIEVRPTIARPGCSNLFVSLNSGGPLLAESLRSLFRRMGRRAGLPAFSPHDLRRTFCTFLLRSGASTRLTQLAGRWSDIRMVEHYSRSLHLHAEDIAPFSPVGRVLSRLPAL